MSEHCDPCSERVEGRWSRQVQGPPSLPPSPLLSPVHGSQGLKEGSGVGVRVLKAPCKPEVRPWNWGSQWHVYLFDILKCGHAASRSFIGYLLSIYLQQSPSTNLIFLLIFLHQFLLYLMCLYSCQYQGVTSDPFTAVNFHLFIWVLFISSFTAASISKLY